MAEDKKIYYQSVLNPSMQAGEILKKYREQMSADLDKYDSYLRDIDKSLDRIDSSSYYIRGQFGNSLNNAADDLRIEAANIRRYTEYSVDPAMDNVCKIRTNEELISQLESGLLINDSLVYTSNMDSGIGTAAFFTKSNDLSAQIKENFEELKDAYVDSASEYIKGGTPLEEYLSLNPSFGGDVGALRLHILKLTQEINEYASKPINSYTGPYIPVEPTYEPVPVTMPVAKYAPAPVSPEPVSPVVPVAKYAPAPVTTSPITIVPVAKYAPAPVSPEPVSPVVPVAKYAPAPVTTSPITVVPVSKYAPAPATPTLEDPVQPVPELTTFDDEDVPVEEGPVPTLDVTAEEESEGQLPTVD